LATALHLEEVMITRRNRYFHLALAALSALMLAGTHCISNAQAQTYPGRSIKLIAPYPPGGGVDTVARLLAERLSPRLGQPVVVDNKPGAGATMRSPGARPTAIR
jgi:tripartite-type tricarboxylate transporter receptor subunit TctC